MKYAPDARRLELTTRNITALRDKLDDPDSARTLVAPCRQVMVRAVEDGDRTDTAAEATATEGVVTLTRSELEQLLAGAAVTVGGIAVVPVADADHYSNRPSGIVVMPSSGEVLEPETTYWRLHHICEVCGKDEILTPAAAYEAGWDYPPKQGMFGVISPRTCPSCLTEKTVWWAIAMDGFTEDMLTDTQRETVSRILAEPASIMVTEP